MVSRAEGGRRVKEERHEAILRIVRDRVIGTQEQLAAALREAGFDVTQATVSRDIRELGLIKVPAPQGGYRYAMPPRSLPPDALGRAQRTFFEYVTDVRFSANLLLVKTLPGGAHVVAAAIDGLDLDEVVGTVAGDDAVLVVVTDGRDRPAPGAASRLFERFSGWRQGAPQ